MKDLIGAMAEEKAYVEDRMRDIDSNLTERLAKFGYSSLTEYFDEKREHIFNEWKPEVHYIDANFLSNDMENAIADKQYGIYILAPENLYAFHGSDEIDYDLCKTLGVNVIEMHYNGGTIIGSREDLGILLVIPNNIDLSGNRIINKFLDIIKTRIPNAEIDGNDILVNGEKVTGSMQRRVDGVFVWAAQISFGEYDDIITKVCNKKPLKKPSRIDKTLLGRDTLEKEVLRWLRKA